MEHCDITMEHRETTVEKGDIAIVHCDSTEEHAITTVEPLTPQ